MSTFPYADRVPRAPHAARARHAPGRGARRAAVDGRRGGRRLGVGPVLGHHVLRRPRPLRLPERGVRRSSPTSTSLQRDMCPSATQFEAEIIAMTLDLLHAEAVDRHRAGRPGVVRWHREHLPRHARLPRPRRRHAGRGPAQRHQARDRPPGLRQGLPPVRDRAPGGPGRPGHHPGRHRLGGRAIDDAHHRPHRLGLQLRLRHHRPDRRRCPTSPSSTGSASTSTAASAAGSSPSARSSATTSPSSTSGSPA